jgi:NAD binding domain of 6-phosphogluconate dehydrogenase
MADKPSVGFVGVGNMGWPMATCLVNAGFTVLVNDSRREVANNFVQQIGGTAPDTLRQLAASSDVVITMLPTSVIVENVLVGGDDNVAAGMKPGTVLIEMSSGVPSVTQVLAERIMELGSHMIDAPVSGGVPRAKTGELAIMVGGDSAIIDSVMPVLSAMGTSVLRTGEQPGFGRRLPDRHRGAADRPALRAGSSGDGRCAERSDGDEQLDAEEVQAVRAVAEVQCRLHDGAAGEGSVDRLASGARDGDAFAAVGVDQGDGGGGAGDVWFRRRSHRDGQALREAGRDAAR